MRKRTNKLAAPFQSAMEIVQAQWQGGKRQVGWPLKEQDEDAPGEAQSKQAQQVISYLVRPAGPRQGLISTENELKLRRMDARELSKIGYLKRLNDIRDVNAFLIDIHKQLPEEGTFVGYAETQELRKERLMKTYPAKLKTLLYAVDFVWRRVFPKIAVLRGIYMLATGGKNQVMSKAEILGRLCYNGFTIVSTKEMGTHLYFVGKKTSSPKQGERPTYGPVARLKRVGKNGKLLTVYKFRTMHPYSEYLQEYVFQHNNIRNDGGKFRDDFRISTLGRFFRRCWLDELPMLLNLLKGDIKLVGVRPISQHYFSMYSRELQEKRTRVKPGFIPPFYADMPQTLDEIMASELNYLAQYEKQPFKTDVKYFFLALHNILIKNHRSH